MSVTLFQHQVEDGEALEASPFYALFHEVGSGKTFPLILRMLEVMLHNPHMWIVVAEIHLMDQWEEDIALLAGDQEVRVATLTGGTKKHHRILTIHDPPDVLLINYEFFSRVELWLFNLARAGKIAGIILDEAHRIKGFRGFRSPHGKRAKSIIKVAHARLGMSRDILRYMATGSPISNPNNPELWALYYFLNPQVMGERLWLFEQEFYINVTPGQNFKKLVLKESMKGELSRRMYTCARRLLKKDLPIDFPEATTQVFKVKMPPRVRRFYTALSEHALAEHDGVVVTRPQLLGRLMALQQVASGFILEEQEKEIVGLDLDWEQFDAADGKIEKKVIRLDSSHKDKIVESIKESIGWESSICWWAHFRHELRHLADLLEKGGARVARAWGDIKARDKKREIKAFKAGDLTDLVAQPASAGAGLNLQIAGYTGRYSRSHKLLDWEQSRGRIDRPLLSGAHERITHFEIVTENSSDMKVFSDLSVKRDVSSELTLDDFVELRT